MPPQPKAPAVYLITNAKNGTLYVGVTSNLTQRIWQHRENLIPSFAGRYACNRLVWFELHTLMPDAIAREKQIKAGRRATKIALIEAANPEWLDLWPTIL